MVKYSFTFGPDGSYFLATPFEWISRGLPFDLRDTLHADAEAQSQNVGLGPDGQWFYGRTTKRLGATWTQSSDSIHEAVKTWLNSRTSSGDGEIHFAYGSGGDWVACTSQGAVRWSLANPDSFSQAARECHPKMATLGVNNSYVLSGTNGSMHWNLKGKYDLLNQVLKNDRTAIDMVAIDPYTEGQFIIIFANRTYRACLPTTYSETVSTAISEAFQLEAQIETEQPKIVKSSLMDGMTPDSPSDSHFWAIRKDDERRRSYDLEQANL